MKTPIKTVFALCAAVVAFSGLEAGAGMYVKYEGIEGEATAADANHDKWIDVLSVDWGRSQQGARARARNPQPPRSGAGSFSLTKAIDASSAGFQRYCSTGGHLTKVYVMYDKDEGRNAGRMYTFLDVTCTAVEMPTESAAGAPPMEQISFNFAKIEWTMDKGSDKDKGPDRKRPN